MFYVCFKLNRFTCFVFYPTFPIPDVLILGVIHSYYRALELPVVWFVESGMKPEFSEN